MSMGTAALGGQSPLFGSLHNHLIRQAVQSLEALLELAHTCHTEDNSLGVAAMFEGYLLLAFGSMWSDKTPPNLSLRMLPVGE